MSIAICISELAFRTMAGSVVGAFCEGMENSLEAGTFANAESSQLERLHVLSRNQSEDDFFGEVTGNVEDRSSPVKLAKGQINAPDIVGRIIAEQPDVLVCYGASLIKSDLLGAFKGVFSISPCP
jgi:hypothetical protein